MIFRSEEKEDDGGDGDREEEENKWCREMKRRGEDGEDRSLLEQRQKMNLTQRTEEEMDTYNGLQWSLFNQKKYSIIIIIIIIITLF